MPLSPDHADKGAVLTLLPQHPDPANREAARQGALALAPGRPVVMLRPAPVKVRAMAGYAIAYTVTHVLVEWYFDGEYQVRWEAAWLVRRV